MKREGSLLLGGWLVLIAFLLGLGWQNLSAPGLFYDEAIYGGLTRDCLAGHAGSHMPGTFTVDVFGAPFPIYVQLYLGALKCWLLLPLFKAFGATMMVLRAANIALNAAGLLCCMLWVWRLLGLGEALLAGLLLVLDPAFFFLGVLDWGSLLPSLLCRFGGFLLALTAWRRQHAGWAFAAGLVLGIGVFNKIDFGVIVLGAGLAALLAGGRAVRVAFRLRPRVPLAALLGFFAGAAPMLALFRDILRVVLSPNTPHNPGELAEKLHALGAMYDGSYFYRLMDAGGVFDQMYAGGCPVWTPFGIATLLAAAVLVGDVLLAPPESPVRRTKIFLLLATAFLTLGALMLPGAVRIHHTTLVYPFPHLLIAAACLSVWHPRWQRFPLHRTVRTLTVMMAGLLVICSFAAIQWTQHLIHETGGRGRWSSALERFAAGVRTRSDLTVSSLDWGFNEQLEFLTAGPRLEEPFWQAVFGRTPALPADTNRIYLVYPPEFSLSPLGTQFMQAAATNGSAVIEPWRDGQGKVAFYAITFKAP